MRCKCLVTSEVSEVVKGVCRYLQTQMEQFIETGRHLEASSWRLLGISFGNLKIRADKVIMFWAAHRISHQNAWSPVTQGELSLSLSNSPVGEIEKKNPRPSGLSLHPCVSDNEVVENTSANGRGESWGER